MFKKKIMSVPLIYQEKWRFSDTREITTIPCTHCELSMADVSNLVAITWGVSHVAV